MKHYIFTFSVEPTDNSWWCTYQNQIVKLSAEDLKTAKESFLNQLNDRYGFDVSKSAASKPKKMYRDSATGEPVQIGLVYKGSTEVDFDCVWKKRYANIWVEIQETTNPFENAA